jgi:hypothetical protein
MQDNLQLVGQVAAVTGGGRGIGRAIAATLSAAGATTAVLARSASEIDKTARMIELAGGRARPFVVDVTDAVTVERTFAEIERSLGPVTLLVNNAAVPGPIGPFWGNGPRRVVADPGCQLAWRCALFSRRASRNDCAQQGQNHQHCEQRHASRLFLELRHEQSCACSIHGDDSGRGEALRRQHVRGWTGNGAYRDGRAYPAVRRWSKVDSLVQEDFR